LQALRNGPWSKGKQTYDQGDPLDFLKLLPPGVVIPEAKDARKTLQESGSGTSRRYTWEWELYPVKNRR